MSIMVTGNIEADVKSRVESGQYASADDVLAAAMAQLKEHEKLVAFRAAIAEAEAEIERGEYIVWTPETMEMLIREAEEEERLGLPLCPDVLP